MTQVLSIYESTKFGALTAADVKTVHETLAKECNESQFRFFMSVASAAGANPLLSEIHASVFQGKLTVQFGVDFYVRKAKETEGYRGYDVQLVHDNDEFEVEQIESEQGRMYMKINQHKIKFPRGQVVGGYAIAYKEGLEPFTILMETNEVEHYKKSNIGMQARMWQNQFVDMFKKHMVKRVLKAAFGLTFEGDGDGVTTHSVDNTQSYERQEVSPQQQEADEVNSQQASRQDKQPEKKQQRIVQDAEIVPEVSEEKIKTARNLMKKNFDILEIVEKDKKAEYVSEKLGIPLGAAPSYDQMEKLLDIMATEIEHKMTGDILPDEI